MTEEGVLEFLQEHPDFFDRYPDALRDLKLQHPTGKAVSLIEKQVDSLRGRNTELRHKLNQLLDNARENDRLFDKSKRLVLALLECEDLGDFVDALYYSFDKDFNVSCSRLILFGQEIPNVNVRSCCFDDARLYLGRKLDSSRAVCGGFAPEELAFLFDKDRPKVSSAAMSVLNYNQVLGIFAIGHQDSEHFQSGMDTLFLTHIGEVLNRLLPLYIKANNRADDLENQSKQY